jgi:hypothetical protein
MAAHFYQKTLFASLELLFVFDKDQKAANTCQQLFLLWLSIVGNHGQGQSQFSSYRINTMAVGTTPPP